MEDTWQLGQCSNSLPSYWPISLLNGSHWTKQAKTVGVYGLSDIIHTSYIFPLKYFVLGVLTLFYKKTLNQELAEEVKREDQLYKRMILISIITALVLTVFATNQLSQVLSSFAQLWQQVFQTLASLLNFNINFENSGLFISRLVTNLPLALGLFSKLVAVYWANDKPLSQKQF